MRKMNTFIFVWLGGSSENTWLRSRPSSKTQKNLAIVSNDKIHSASKVNGSLEDIIKELEKMQRSVDTVISIGVV